MTFPNGSKMFTRALIGKRYVHVDTLKGNRAGSP